MLALGFGSAWYQVTYGLFGDDQQKQMMGKLVSVAMQKMDPAPSRLKLTSGESTVFVELDSLGMVTMAICKFVDGQLFPER